MKESPIARMFCELVAIPSPSGSELEVGKYIQRYLKGLDIACHFDSSGPKNGSNSGNLIATMKGNMPTKVMFVAHMDTVEVGDRNIIPIIKDGNITSEGDTILGCDNKASVACLLAAMKEARKLKNKPDIVCVFSTREENGLMGVKYLDIKGVDYVFVLDGGKRAGTFIKGSLGYLPFDIKINGKAAHAAANPDQGANAIKAAGIFISGLELGRDMYEGTMNIGKIEGGTKINVVPDTVVMHGEVRGFTENDIDRKLREMEAKLKDACKATKCSYEITVKRENFITPFLAGHEDRIMAIAERAAKAAKLEFAMEKLSATCEANPLKQKYPMVLGVNRGGKAPHSKDESVSYGELEQLKRLIAEIIKATG